MNIGRIIDIINETDRIKTFILDIGTKAIPGQFGMFWLPGVDEKPMSLSYTDGKMGVTILKLGNFSTKMHELEIGARIGVKGPLGRGYKIKGDNILIVGGGVGNAPLAPLAETALAAGKKVTAILGAQTAREILFEKRIKKAGAKVLVATDDGTAGHKGYTTDIMMEILKNESFDQCFTCGPEIMMVKVLLQTKEKKIPAQVSLHRYFKCGIGICGQCAMDNTGIRVCKEGPCFRDKEMDKTEEFGKYWRDGASTRLYFGAKK
jgi:dihydroorotate dehydrogenase electron transfer subunit